MANLLASETAKTALIIAAILFIPVGVFMYANNSSNNARVESEQDQIANIKDSLNDDSNNSTDDNDLNATNETDTNDKETGNDVKQFPNTSSKQNVLIGYGDTKESIIRSVCGDEDFNINNAINDFIVIPGRFVDITCN